MTRTLLATFFLLAAASVSQAQTMSDPEFGVTFGASSLGATVEPSMRLSDHWGVRMPIGGGNFDFDDESNGEEYSGDVDLGGIGLLADYYPVAGRGFRLTAGAFYTDYSADLVANNVQVSGITTNITAEISQEDRFLPAVAVGYDGRLGERGLLSVSVGGMFGNEFDLDARESTGLVSQDQVDQEVADIRDDLKDFDIIPFVQLSVGFRF